MGISYAVVTKVKELTETRQYGEALDLLEGEDIFQSLNPQFLRSCGEVYLENNRYYESREALIRAHIMAPEGNRIIYDLVHLYLRMGYFQRAKRYYELYVFHAAQDDVGKLYLQYMIQKANRVEASELLNILERACEEQYSDEWGFELALLYASLGMKEKMKEECIHIMAAFRNSPYCTLAEDLKKEQYDISNSYFRFPLMEAEEDLETYASLLPMEEKQLEKDMLKIHPPAPVILQMEDDDGTEEPVPERKENGFGIKIPFGKKRGKEAEKEKADSSDGETMASEATSDEQRETKTESDSEETEKNPEMAITQEGQKTEDRNSDESSTQTRADTEDVSAYIEAVMKSVADIEASAVEEMKNPISFEHITDTTGSAGTSGVSPEEASEGKIYQPKLVQVEENLSPKERLEQLMKLIEAERAEENKKKESVPQEEEELDLDEFLMDLVGASTITQAMVKSYREETQSGQEENDKKNEG